MNIPISRSNKTYTSWNDTWYMFTIGTSLDIDHVTHRYYNNIEALIIIIIVIKPIKITQKLWDGNNGQANGNYLTKFKAIPLYL